MKRYCNVCIYETLPNEAVDIPRGTVIFHEGDQVSSIYRIHEGFVKVLKYHENGDEKIFDILGKDDFLALLLVLQNKDQYIATAIALTDCVLHKISKQSTQEAYHKNTIFQQTCLSCAAGRANQFHNQLFQITTNEVDDKILGVLAHLYHKFGTYKNGIHSLYLPINQTDLANIIGIRRETLSRRLKVLQEEGTLELDKYLYILHDI